MANDEINNENTQDMLGLESDSLDALEALDKINPEEAAENVSDDLSKSVKDIDELKGINEADLKLDFDEPEAENAADTELKDYIRDTDDKPERKPRSEKREAPRRERPHRDERRPDGARRRPDGRRPQGDGRRRPDSEGRRRPDGEARRRPEGERRRRPEGEVRRRPDGAKRPRPEGAQGGNGKKKKGWSKKKKTIVITVVTIVLTLLLIAGIVIALFFVYTGKLNREVDSTVNSEAPPMDSSELVSKPDTISKEDEEAKLKEMLSKRQQPITDDNVMNILVIGEDLRDTTTAVDGTTPRGNTDVQMLISINKQTKKIVLASFLRDQYVNIEGFGMNRLNSAYWHNGITLLKDTISNYYNIHIDRYIKVNFYSFIDVIETIGGVDIDISEEEFGAINEAIREHNKYLNNPPEKDYIKAKGYQHLNGNQALAYARIREGCGDDYGRTERQREMITTVIGKMKNLSIIELNYLFDTIAPQISTDISNGEIAYLLFNASDIMGYQVCQVQMPHYPYFTEEIINQMAVLVPDYDKCSTLLLDMIYGDSTTVEQAIQKMNAGTINKDTYTKGGSQAGQQNQGNGQNTLDNQPNMAIQSKDQIPKLRKSA